MPEYKSLFRSYANLKVKLKGFAFKSNSSCNDYPLPSFLAQSINAHIFCSDATPKC